MGESKLPIYAFVDETGNTGHNLFDQAQPDFFTAALITKGDFDINYGDRALALSTQLGVGSLHGKELGFAGLEGIAGDLLSLLRQAKAHFFVSRVEKQYLLVSKVFDSIFDSGENAAVGWHHYNFRALRLMLVFKLAATIDSDTAKLFWSCILERNEAKARETLKSVCARLHGNLLNIPDHRSREVLGAGLEWAWTHPEAIQIHTDRKLSRQGHFPNFVAFVNLLDGLEKHAKDHRKRVARITHDQQSEFDKALAMAHDVFSNASREEIHWAGETYSLQRVVGSEFEVRKDELSAGIQVADVVLWLYSQFRKGRKLPSKCSSIMSYVLAHGWESDFSFDGVERMYLKNYGAVLSTPLGTDQENRAREFLEHLEKSRIASMEQYERDKLPPFMRQHDAVAKVDDAEKAKSLPSAA